MKNTIKKTDRVRLTEENIHTFPKDVQEVYAFLKQSEGKVLGKEKYYKSQKDRLVKNINALYQSSPDLPLKQVLFKIMEPLPDFLPAENLVAVTKIITSTWEELRKKVAA